MKNETAIVTGSTSGIGKKIAELFLKEGCKVAICSRNEDSVQKTTSEFQEKFGDSVTGFTCDASDLATLKSTVDKTVDAFGSIRILVANAGLILTYGPFEFYSPEKIVLEAQEVIGTNLIGMINSVATVLPQMINQGYGRIITLSGGGASRPLPNMTIYSASKGGVVTFSKCLAEEFKARKEDIKINIFHPGMIKTNLFKIAKVVDGWKDEETYNRERSLATEFLATDIEKSCSKVIPYAIPSCKTNGKVFRGFSIWKMIRGGRKYQKVLKKMRKEHS